jgi:hypothetical protein
MGKKKPRRRAVCHRMAPRFGARQNTGSVGVENLDRARSSPFSIRWISLALVSVIAPGIGSAMGPFRSKRRTTAPKQPDDGCQMGVRKEVLGGMPNGGDTDVWQGSVRAMFRLSGHHKKTDSLECGFCAHMPLRDAATTVLGRRTPRHLSRTVRSERHRKSGESPWPSGRHRVNHTNPRWLSRRNSLSKARGR